MKWYRRRKKMIAALMIGTMLTNTAPAHALTVWDPGVNATLVAFHTAVITVLLNIGSTISSGNKQIIRTIEASARTEREFLSAQAQNRRNEEARRRYQLPKDICAESISSAQANVNNATHNASAALRSGHRGTFNNPDIKAIFQTPEQSPEDRKRLMVRAHRGFCDNEQFAAYGNSDTCPEISKEFPGGDSRVDSLLTGARPDGDAPSLTFTQAQIETARLYTENTYNQDISPLPTSEQADTQEGKAYLGDMNAYRAMMSAAKQPAERSLARRIPNPQTQTAIEYARSTRSGNLYFEEAASQEAKRTGQMSQLEFDMFNINRRHVNIHYASVLQNMESDNLVREQIRVGVQTNALLLDIRQELELTNLIAGQQLASAARQEYGELLDAGHSNITIEEGED